MPIPIKYIANAIKAFHPISVHLHDKEWRDSRNVFLTEEGVRGVLEDGVKVPLPEYIDDDHLFWFDDQEQELLFVLKWS